MIRILLGKLSKLEALIAGSGVVIASIKDASSFEAQRSISIGKTPLLLYLGRLVAILNRLRLTDFTIADCSRATRSS